MKHFVIESGVIVNSIECAADFNPGSGKSILSAEGAEGDIGWAVVAGVPVAPVVTPPPVTPAMVARERQRRFDLGFDYDFGDGRGVHHIGTSEADKVGWGEVTDISNAAIALGAPNTPIYIVTETGSATITAMEWQSVLLAAGQARQPLWAASFALQAMNPIPSDYTDDQHWT